jgi:predicted ribosomally synthesized peptide with SipW-like signal peptide
MRSYKKMGFLFLALVIVLAGIGVGYAAWTDSVTIQGTLQTGKVDLDVIGYSGTWVYKTPGIVEHEIYISQIGDNDPNLPAGAFLVASATAVEGDHAPYDVVMTWDNLFPCIDFTADVLLHYDGTIPAKVNSLTWGLLGDPDAATLAKLEKLDVAVTGAIIGKLNATSGEVDEYAEPIPVDLGSQLHYCDVIEVAVTIHVPQDNDLMCLSGSAWAKIEVVQWNEYPYVAPTPAPTT